MNYTLQQIEALHKKYAPSDEVYDRVFTHCQVVCDVAMQLIENHALKVDVDLVRAGCLLHDIGAYALVDAKGVLSYGASYMAHGIEGEAILRKEGFPEELCRIASHHTGTGISRQEVIDEKLPLPPADYLAETDEEQLVMYADKFHSKTTPQSFNSFAWYKQASSRFGADKPAKFEQLAQKFGKPDLELLAQKYNYDIK